MRPDKMRFGNVFIYRANLIGPVETHSTPELDLSWKDENDPNLTDDMPSDVALWWPSVKKLDDTPTITHITYYEDGEIDMIAKKPDFQSVPGEVIASLNLPPQDK